jgi:prevent-host-death family protein
MARRLTSTQARASLADAINRASFAGQRTVIRRHGRDVAAVVSAEDLKILEALEDQRDLDDARNIMKKPGRLVSWKKVKKDFGIQGVSVLKQSHKLRHLPAFAPSLLQSL